MGYLQKFRLTTFGKILLASLSVLLVMCFAIIICNPFNKGKSKPSNSPSDAVLRNTPPSSTPDDIKPAPSAESNKLYDSLKDMCFAVYFYPDSAEIKEESYQVLDTIVSLHTAADSLAVQIEGNTAKIPDVDDTEVDDSLCRQRAKAVADYLTGKGISAGNVKIVSNGTNKPAASNDTEEGRQLNRRADVYFK